jgi:HPr serine kinase-like protein
MPIRELMGASVEVASAGFDLPHPPLDVRFPEGIAHLVADRDHAIMSVAGVGTFAIAEGSRIRFEPEPSAPASAVSTWLHGTVAGLLLAQRGRFALHASVVEIDGVAIAVAGAPGAGKSTTALRLTQSGHPLVADDVSPLDGEGPVTVHPFARPLHVWPEAAAALGVELAAARPVLPDHPKLSLPTASGEPVRVGAIAVLEPTDAAVSVDAVRVRGARAHSLVSANIYRVKLLRGLYGAEMFAWAASVAANVPVHLVTRPDQGWTVDAVAGTVERMSSMRAASSAGSSSRQAPASPRRKNLGASGS